MIELLPYHLPADDPRGRPSIVANGLCQHCSVYTSS